MHGTTVGGGGKKCFGNVFTYLQFQSISSVSDGKGDVPSESIMEGFLSRLLRIYYGRARPGNFVHRKDI
jgi:hypothetical protein